MRIALGRVGRVGGLVAISAIAVYACRDYLSAPAPIALASRSLMPNVTIRKDANFAEVKRLRLAARKAKYLKPEVESRLRAAHAALTPQKRERIAEALAQTEWVGRLHNATLLEADLVVRKAWSEGTLTRDKVCGAVEHALANASIKIGLKTGVVPPRAIANKPEWKKAGCGNSPSNMSVLSMASPPHTTAASVIEDEPLTGEYLEYLQIMDAAVTATDGSVSQVTAAVNDVLAAASGIASAYFSGVYYAEILAM